MLSCVVDNDIAYPVSDLIERNFRVCVSGQDWVRRIGWSRAVAVVVIMVAEC